MKSILVTGLCTLHWGRLQYGNIGNYYIVEPLFRQLHKHFPDYKIVTTFQMDEQFIRKEDIEVVPMELYYAWNEDDVPNAYKDVEVAEKRAYHIECELTPWVECLLNCEYVINVSGDMWGDNAEHVGHKRFLVDCLKMKAAQILQKKTILYAVTPGPFSDPLVLDRNVIESGSLDAGSDIGSAFLIEIGIHSDIHSILVFQLDMGLLGRIHQSHLENRVPYPGHLEIDAD